MVYCFSVPTHGFFVTRRNGKVAIQGNTADAALAFAEMQVFQPERQDFDFEINRKLLLNEFGIKYWKFLSNAPVTRDPEVVAKMIKDLMNSNAFTALDVRPLLEEVFNREFRSLNADWAKQPVALTLAGVPPTVAGEPVFGTDLSTGDLDEAGRKVPGQGGVHVGGPFEQNDEDDKRRRKTVGELFDEMDVVDQAKYLIRLREKLSDAEAQIAKEANAKIRDGQS